MAEILLASGINGNDRRKNRLTRCDFPPRTLLASSTLAFAAATLVAAPTSAQSRSSVIAGEKNQSAVDIEPENIGARAIEKNMFMPSATDDGFGGDIAS